MCCKHMAGHLLASGFTRLFGFEERRLYYLISNEVTHYYGQQADACRDADTCPVKALHSLFGGLQVYSENIPGVI